MNSGEVIVNPDRELGQKELEELEELYDFDSGVIETPPINDGLTPSEKAEVEFYAQIKTGVMVITGEPGSGKETFMHFLLWKLRTLFKGFRVLLDKKPRMLFGRYIPFSEEILMDEWKNLSDRYRSGKYDLKRDFARYSKKKEIINQLVNHWTEQNESLFYNAGMGLAEFWRYFYNREPHNPMNKAVSPLLRRYRHHHLLVIGTTPDIEELDTKSCLRRLTHEIRCQQTSIPGYHAYTIYKRRQFQGSSIIEVASKPIVLFVDAKAPRKRLGGKCIYDLFNSYETGESIPMIKHIDAGDKDEKIDKEDEENGV